MMAAPRITQRHVRRALGALGATVRWLGVLGPLAGCLDVPDSPAPMCKSNTDCDRDHGEVCEEGVCWGNPPPGPYAAVLAPPSGRHDLVPQELADLSIPDFGWMGDLVLDVPVSLSGRVVAFCPPPLTGCDATTLAATITVSRPSVFHGGPGFSTAINVKAGDSFSIAVPRSHPGDPLYTMTVVPDSGTPAAQQLPPLHLQLAAPRDTPVMTVLGGLELPTISGTLLDSYGQGLQNYRVAALGRWESAAPPTEVSTVKLTDAAGRYTVTLSDELAGTVELVARPLGPAVGPTIHVANIDPTLALATTRNVTLPAGLGVPTPVAIHVSGLDRSGALVSVVGAVVSVTGSFSNLTTATSFTITDEQVTDKMGNVVLHVLDGASIAGSYRLSITPPASSNLGVVFDEKLVLGALPGHRLPPRIALHGRILDRDGKPVPNVAVTARPSLRFLWTLETQPQTFVAAIPSSTAVTPDTTSGEGAGAFVLWVDANVASVWGHYDVLIEPPMTARMPTFVKADIDVRTGTLDSVGLGDITVPEAAFVHGRITGANGQAVDGAELKLYVVSSAITLCSEVAHAPQSCPIPAELRSRNTSDSDGIVRLTLPR